MIIIEINSLSNKAHRNQIGNFPQIPEGWALIPEDMIIPDTFPFVDIEVEEVTYYNESEEPYTMMTVTSMIAGEVPGPDIDSLITSKVEEIRTECNKAIISGIDVETTQGTEHFGLEETDRINLTTALSAIQAGATTYPYHADGQLCRLFTADEINAICNASIEHKLYHTTLCNHLLTWARRSTDANEIQSIAYTQTDMPEDLLENMLAILSNASATLSL